jgi:hypothetical protein
LKCIKLFCFTTFAFSKLWRPILRREHKLQLLRIGLLKGTFAAEMYDATGGWSEQIVQVAMFHLFVANGIEARM